MAGDIERVSGRYLVGHGTELYSINLTTVAATPVILPLGVTIGSELVPDGTNPYTVTGGRLVIVNVLASPMTVRSTRLTGIPGNAEIGSMWINWTGGSLWMKVNGTGKTYSITSLNATPIATLVGTGVTGGGVDGASQPPGGSDGTYADAEVDECPRRMWLSRLSESIGPTTSDRSALVSVNESDLEVLVRSAGLRRI